MSAPSVSLPSDISANSDRRDPYLLGRGPTSGADVTGHGEGGPASTFVTVAYGFWIFLLSDIVMFSGFFAAYAVLAGAQAGGASGRELFDVTRVAAQTGLLLTSTLTMGLAMLASHRRRLPATQGWLVVTGLLGAGFLFLEVQEFVQFVEQGAGPTRSAFLSAFFALVGCHGLHVALGLIWLGTSMAQLWMKGFRADIERRLHCLSLFWHALDIVWIAIFSLVYLLGVAA